MAKARLPMLAILCWGLYTMGSEGCGGDSSARPCRDAPTYANDVRPLTEASCLGCHSEQLSGIARRGAPETLNYDSFELIEPHRQAFANAFTSGIMPPPDSGLTVNSLERDIVSSWRRCGFLP